MTCNSGLACIMTRKSAKGQGPKRKPQLVDGKTAQFRLLAFPCRTGWTNCVDSIWRVGLAILILTIIPLGAQLPEVDATGSEFAVATWKTDQGLPQNWVECLLQTRNGYLWAGTRMGLARFDGVRFVSFRGEDSLGLASETPKALAEDSEGSLWIGTKAGLLRLRTGTFQSFGVQDGLCHDEITSLAMSRRGGLWIGTAGGVNYLGHERFSSFLPQFTDDKHISSLLEDPHGTLWIGLRSGLYQLNQETGNFQNIWRVEGRLPTRDYNNVTRIFADAEAQLWFGTPYGIYTIKDGVVRQHSTEKTREPNEVRAIYEDKEKSLWVMTEKELYRYRNETLDGIALDDDLRESRMRSLCCDREGNLWIGTQFGGLNRLQRRVLRTLSAKDGLRHTDVWSISEARNGTVWVGTTGGIDQFPNGRSPAQPLLFEHHDSNVSVRSALQDRHKGAWIATTYNGLWHLERANEAWYMADLWPGHTQGRVVFEDNAGNVWGGTKESLVLALAKPNWCEDHNQRFVNTHGECWVYKTNEVLRVVGLEHWCHRSGVWEHHPKNIIYHTKEHECNGPVLDPRQDSHPDWTSNKFAGTLANFDVRAILQDRRGTIWFGTAGGGLNRLQDRRFTAFTIKDGLVSNEAWALHEDADGSLWIGTKEGLSRFKNGRFFNFNTQQGLFDNLINQILEDDFGYFWIGCKKGIFRVNREALNQVAEGKAASVDCISFGESDGMLASETNGQTQSAGCKTRDGKLWFPTVRGVVIVDPAKARQNQTVPKVIIEEIRANDSSVFKDGRILVAKPNREPPQLGRSELQNGLAEIALPAGSGNFVEFQYTATSLSAAEKVRFKYRLQGQSAWTDAGSRRIAYFTNLRPGSYTFEVSACNNDGIWNESGASLALTIAPYFYQTNWFPAACGLGTILLGYGLRGFTARRQRQLQELKGQLALEQERARIAQDIHDDLGAHLTQIGLLADLANRALAPEHHAFGQVQKIAHATGEGSRSLDEIVWALNPQNDSLRSLANYLRNYASEYLSAARIRCDLISAVELPIFPVSAQMRHHVYLIFKEALRNIVQHAHATRVTIHFSIESAELVLELGDDGRGFDLDQARRSAQGNGLSNMETRAIAVHSSFSIVTQLGSGTIIRLGIPLPHTADANRNT